jgi:hypothetical protein
MTATNDVMADILRAVAAADDIRAQRATTAMRTLRRYERRLVREAAVMGFVLGYRHGFVDGRSDVTPNGSTFPADDRIIVNVINACDTSDGYPYITDACNGRRRRVTRTRLYHPQEPR